MSTTSKKYFDEKLKKEVWGKFLNQIKSLTTGDDLDNFLNKYFTPREKIIIEKRLIVLNMLQNGASYRDVGKNADVTLKTISFIKSGFKKPKKRIVKEHVVFKEAFKPVNFRKFRGRVVKKSRGFRYKGARL